ncbi:hypothetical protein L873DRAFT_1464936 [Choiromyces venosus 120613-1]|uniref:Uncharacterized protein n=1 Tax=Choiromyces venosus 120613-1 TaxID=1336337 RepID=A0A3N4K138_9PEZI|nr:hypothetical protein L873DRAFT_1464936 [Choiromyces venosus 120613-1]
MAAAGCLIWDSRKGRHEMFENVTCKLAGIKERFQNVTCELTGITGRLGNIENDLQNVTCELTGITGRLDNIENDLAYTRETLGTGIAAALDDVRSCQKMVLEGCHHTMKALTGDKKPMQQWLKELEHCKEDHNLVLHQCSQPSRAPYRALAGWQSRASRAGLVRTAGHGVRLS